PSPNGRGWPAPAGRVRGTASIKAILFICPPHPPLRGTLSRWERDSQFHTSDSENQPVGQIDWSQFGQACLEQEGCIPPSPQIHSHLTIASVQPFGLPSALPNRRGPLPSQQ